MYNRLKCSYQNKSYFLIPKNNFSNFDFHSIKTNLITQEINILINNM